MMYKKYISKEQSPSVSADLAASEPEGINAASNDSAGQHDAHLCVQKVRQRVSE